MIPGLPASFAELARRRRELPRAAGPCSVPGCPGIGPGRVYDHCHLHDHVRGVVCLWCNTSMITVDARVDPDGGRLMLSAWRPMTAAQRHAALIEHWRQCPACSAAGWEPRLTRAEYDRASLVRQVRALAAAIADGTRPAAELAAHREGLNARCALALRRQAGPAPVPAAAPAASCDGATARPGGPAAPFPASAPAPHPGQHAP